MGCRGSLTSELRRLQVTVAVEIRCDETSAFRTLFHFMAPSSEPEMSQPANIELVKAIDRPNARADNVRRWGRKLRMTTITDGDGLIDNELIELSSRQKGALVYHALNGPCVGDVLDRVG